MLQVILWIGKLIGILLLVLLALLLLVLLLVLFAPIRYRFRAEFEKTLSGTGRVRWLYPLLEVTVEIQDNKPVVRIRIFGILLDTIKAWLERRKQRKLERKRARRKKQKLKQKKKRAGKGARGASSARKTAKPVAGSAAKPAAKPVDQSVTSSGPAAKAEPEVKPESEIPMEAPENEAAKPTLRQRITGWFRKVSESIREKWQALKAKVAGILDKIKEIRGKITGLWGQWENIRELLAQETTKASLHLILEQLKRLLRHLKPKKLEIWLRYGTGDPYTLGQHLTAMAVVYGFLGEYFQVEPDWDEKVLQARGYVKGRIRIFTLLRICIKVMTDKNVKVLWKQVSERRQTNDGK